jgi:iron(III) transport system substrate-binding protein
MITTGGRPNARQLVVYSAVEERQTASLAEGFSRRHPDISIDMRFGISTALHHRYLEDLKAGTPQADIMWSSGLDLQLSLVTAAHAAEYASPEAGDLPRGAVYKNMAFATTLEPLCTLIDRNELDVRTPAGSVAEIAAQITRDPGKFRGRIACCDIERNGVAFLALLYESRRKQTFHSFMQCLSATRPRIYVSIPEAIADLEQGRSILVYHLLASYALRAAQANPRLAIAHSNEQPIAISRVAFIPRNAPHPETARLFMDYLLSREGQQHLDESGLFPIRGRTPPGAENGPSLVLPIDQGCPELLASTPRRQLVEQWRDAVHAPDMRFP